MGRRTRTVDVEASPASRGRARSTSRARRHGRGRGAPIFEPPRFFEAFLRGPALHRGPGHHGPDLRDLPRRLPDELLRRHGGRAAACTSPTAVREPAAAALLRRVDPEPRAPRLPPPRPRLPRLPGRGPAGRGDRGAVERGLRIKRTGNRLMEAVGGRAVHPVNVRVGGFYRAPEPDDVAALAGPLEGPWTLALATVAWVVRLRLPRRRERLPLRRAAPPGALPDRAGPGGLL